MPDETDPGLQKVRQLKPTAEQQFQKLLGDVSVGITRIDGVYGLKVNYQGKLDPAVEIPSAIDGVPIKFEVVGRVVKRPQQPS